MRRSGRVEVALNRQAVAERGKRLDYFTIAWLVVDPFSYTDCHIVPTFASRAATASQFEYPEAGQATRTVADWGMTNQQTNLKQRPQHREDYKVEKLVERVQAKLTLQEKVVRDQATPPKNQH